MPTPTSHQALTQALTHLQKILATHNQALSPTTFLQTPPSCPSPPAPPSHIPPLSLLKSLSTTPQPHPETVPSTALALFKTLLTVLNYVPTAPLKANPLPPPPAKPSRKCNNCGQTAPRQWVRGRKHINEWLCHPCGQFWRKNGVRRPRELCNRPTYRRASRKRGAARNRLQTEKIAARVVKERPENCTPQNQEGNRRAAAQMDVPPISQLFCALRALREGA